MLPYMVLTLNHFPDFFSELVPSCSFFNISALKSLQGSHTTSFDTLQVHPLPQVHVGHLHFGFVHLSESFSWSIAVTWKHKMTVTKLIEYGLYKENILHGQKTLYPFMVKLFSNILKAKQTVVISMWHIDNRKWIVPKIMLKTCWVVSFEVIT